MSSPLLPLLALIVNALVAAAAGIAGGIGLLLAGQWRILVISIAALALVCPLIQFSRRWQAMTAPD